MGKLAFASSILNLAQRVYRQRKDNRRRFFISDFSQRLQIAKL